MKTTAQSLAAIDAAAGSGRSLPELLCVDCTTALGLSGCVMALMNDAGHQGVVGASGGVAAQLEDLQFELGEGPSVNASHFARPVFHSDLVTAGEMSAWPGFGPEAVGAGVRAVFAFPLQVGGVRLGTLCLYRSTAAQLDREEMASALAYADAALVVLLGLQAEMQPGSVLHPDLASRWNTAPRSTRRRGFSRFRRRSVSRTPCCYFGPMRSPASVPSWTSRVTCWRGVFAFLWKKTKMTDIPARDIRQTNKRPLS